VAPGGAAAPVPAPDPRPGADVVGRGVERALARKRQKYEDEVDRLVAAALVVMRARDTADPTVTDILAEAGLSTAAFYRHFPGKDDLLLALLQHAGATTRSYLDHRLARHADPVERIAAWVRGMFDLLRTPDHVLGNRPFLLAHPRLVERFPAEIARMTGELVEPLAAAIADARAGHGLEPTDHRTDARLVHHQVYGVLVDRAAERRTSDRREVDAVVDYTLRAVLGPSVATARSRAQAAPRRRGKAAS
jgi:AcrR family transcriptional regulator